jgi:membrane protein required for colicin V production
MNSLDLAVVIVILVSGLLAFARGFVREELSVATWVGAAFAELYAFPYARDFAAQFLPPGLAVDATALMLPFLLALLILGLIAHAIALRVPRGPLSVVDRTLGLLFGLARGAFIVCLGYIGLMWLMPAPPHPPWLEESRIRPLLETGAEGLRRLLPGIPADHAAGAKADPAAIQRQVEDAAGAYSTPHAPPPARPESRYDRHGLDQLFQREAQ